MWVASYVGGKDLNVAITGIETALWDIVGKALGAPVFTLLGGRCHDRLPLYYDFCDAYGGGVRGSSGRLEGDSSLDGVAKQARFIKEQKFPALKTHPLGLAPRPAVTRHAGLKAIHATVEKIQTIREAVGDDVDICLDVHNTLDLPSSMALAKALEPYPKPYIEELTYKLLLDEDARVAALRSGGVDYARISTEGRQRLKDAPVHDRRAHQKAWPAASTHSIPAGGGSSPTST